MNKCDLEETKHIACQKFLDLVYSDTDRWNLKDTTNYYGNGSIEWGPPYYFERDKFQAYRDLCEVRVGYYLIWSLTEQQLPTAFDDKMIAACKELKARHDNWQKQLQCEAILKAMAPEPERKPPEIQKPVSFLSKIKQFWKEIGE